MTKICARYGWFPGSSSSSNASSWVDAWTELLEWTLCGCSATQIYTNCLFSDLPICGLSKIKWVCQKKGHPIPEDDQHFAHFMLGTVGLWPSQVLTDCLVAAGRNPPTIQGGL
jgi:hypothetical protein